jgi:hypothetical protein
MIMQRLSVEYSIKRLCSPNPFVSDSFPGGAGIIVKSLSIIKYSAKVLFLIDIEGQAVC